MTLKLKSHENLNCNLLQKPTFRSGTRYKNLVSKLDIDLSAQHDLLSKNSFIPDYLKQKFLAVLAEVASAQLEPQEVEETGISSLHTENFARRSST